MARLDSFYLPPGSWRPPFRMEGDEARHLVKVLRLGPGARVRCFDGQGREGIFTVESTKGAVTLSLETESMVQRPAVETWLALGWNKSTRRGWLMEKAVELNAAGIMFWEAERSQGGMPETPKDTWKAQLVAGAKQCGNPWLPALEMVRGGSKAIIERCNDFEHRWLLWESGDIRQGLARENLISAGRHVFVLGPEGGLTQAEALRFQETGFTPVTLGPRPLRWETAALLSLGLSWWAQDPNTK
ncbi:MAG: 16S rRNA (uracil(1498)-N(3))-methyltransferase [Desulfovibrio sp.]|nr:16S rRNA (uracil(1498)-N(3))-methyltransferase [Desulfovibrio sp.]MBI4961130.1 16S rRNA (uracil(1498)-N(3))-methyltransferase [Desulfovibrio sp.]